MSDQYSPIQLERLTSSDVASFLSLKDKKNGLLLPVGSCEQHGPCLPLGCDSIIAAGAAAHLAEGLKQNSAYRALVAPAFCYTPSPGAEHMPGTISVSFDWLGRGLQEVLRGALCTAWDFAAIINAHAHNQGRVIEAAIAGTQGTLGRRVPVVVLNIYEYARLCITVGLNPGRHAGEFELALCTYYSGTAPAGIQAASQGTARRERPPQIYGLRIEPRSIDGIIADEAPDVGRAVQVAGELGRALDNALCAALRDNLDAYFTCWHKQHDEHT